MDPTTLVTFLYRAPPEIRTVELLGSWDNFQQPYRMYHDRRRGAGFYSGCFTFENIIFDGDLHMHPSKPRSGGLKQGGTYWYYYRLNYDFDAFDDRQPRTTACPLLPGQEVNIVDVPTEVLDLPSRCHSAYGDVVGIFADYDIDHTLDPASKFALLSPPPRSKVHARCLSDDALNGRLENSAMAQVNGLESPIPAMASNDEQSSDAPNGQAQPLILHEQPRTRSLASRPRSPLSQAGDLAPRPRIPHDGPDDGYGIRNVDASAIQTIQQSHLLSQPLFAEHIFSGRSGVLSTLMEDIAPDEDVFNGARSSHEPDGNTLTTYMAIRPCTSASDGPVSALDPPTNNSPPRSETSEQFSPHLSRLYSLRNIDLQDYSSPSSPTSQFSMPSPQESDQTTPGFELPGFEFPEPTLDSVHSASVNDETIHDITDRLRALNSDTNAATSDQSLLRHASDGLITTTGLSSQTHRPRGPFWTYSLPSDVTDSNHSLAKTISAHSHASGGRHVTNLPPRLDLPASTTTSSAAFWPSSLGRDADACDDGSGGGGGGGGPEELSIAEAIFSELGYLSESIA